jgi:hypothetical protein
MPPTATKKLIGSALLRVFQELMETPDRAFRASCSNQQSASLLVRDRRRRVSSSLLNMVRAWQCVAQCTGWSGPVFLTIAGGAFGPQIGGTSTDVVMIFRNRDGFQKLLSDKFKIGADAAVTDPVGRHVGAATDVEMHVEILTYSRSRGVFAGVSLEGAVVNPDRKADEAPYGRNVDREAILNAKVPLPPAARELVAEIRRYTEGEKARSE